MTHAKLTRTASGRHRGPMRAIQAIGGRTVKALVAISAVAMLSGCITLEAPDEPIVIELNINITQEVIYRLAEDAGNTIDENADIF